MGHHARLVLEGERAGSSGALSSQARILLLQLAMKKGDEDAVKVKHQAISIHSTDSIHNMYNRYHNNNYL